MNENQWVYVCFVVVVAVVVMVYVLKSVHIAPPLSYHHLITKIIATNSMFKPDLKNTHTHTRRSAIFCAYFTVAVVIAVRLNGAQCYNSCARSLCLYVCACVDFVGSFLSSSPDLYAALAERARTTQ